MPPVTAETILDLFRRVGALLEGHFRLTSGLHSPGYLQCALVLQHPGDAEACGAAIAERIVALEQKLVQKNEVVAELLQEHVQLKKEIGEL